jgi:hypothetical protein
MGHGLDDYAKRNGGRKMKIDFSAGRVRPLDPVQAAKLSTIIFLKLLVMLR